VKILVGAGWVLLALEVFFVGSLFVTKNMGDDAAGRGMARGFALLLGPIVLLAGALLAWGSRGGPKAVLWVALLLVFAPVLYGAANLVSGTAGKIDRSLGQAEYGRFDDAALTALARAISKGDTAAVTKMLATTRPDWNARDRRDQTILGHAIVRAIDDYSGVNGVVFVRMLLDAGAPVASNVISPERRPSSVSEHNLVYHLYGVHNPSALAILDMVLAAGLSPNEVDEDSVPIYFSSYTVLPALQILRKHGADFTRLDPRTDRLHQNALMHAVTISAWDQATFFLEQGLSPDYTAPDGRSARSILAEVDPPGSQYYGDDEKHHAIFLERLAAQSR
jgi:hypothetical protein